MATISLARAHSRSAPVLSVVLIGTWLAICTLIFFRIETTSFEHRSVLASIFIAVCLVFISFFVLHSTYCFAVGAACLLRRGRPKAILGPSKEDRVENIAVAILYLVKDDFDEGAAVSCLNQDYGLTHVFLLDDSTEEKMRDQVDAFVASRNDRVALTLVRRADSSGFKAGNLNHALRGPASQFPVFAVVDSDCIIPRDFVRQLVQPFGYRGDVAFVQARCDCRASASQQGLISDRIAPAVEIVWYCYEAYRCEYGFQAFMGHGALVSRAAWASVNGFPEVLSEDLAFSIETALRGYTGYYMAAPVCCESVPATFAAFRRRQARYCSGAVQVLMRYSGDLARNSCLRWWERLDILLAALTNIIPGVVLPYLLLLSLATMSTLFSAATSEIAFVIPAFRAWIVRPGWSDMMTRTLYGLSGICLCVPALTAMSAGREGIVSRARYVLWATVLYLAVMPDCFLRTIRLIVSRRAHFAVTGSQAERNVSKTSSMWIASVLLIVGLMTLNLYLAAIASAVLVARSAFLEADTTMGTVLRSIPVLIVALAISALVVESVWPVDRWFVR
jgi:cellulose synthase/poly-beta-1,6-N-acetylglucosamine synthase-like glycosyltransferase